MTARPEDFERSLAEGGPAVLGDPDLRGLSLRRDESGRPFALRGSTGLVYFFQADQTTKSVLKVFQRDLPQLARRYGCIGDVVRQTEFQALVGSRYLPEGLWASDAWHPSLTMEWCPGRPIDQVLDDVLANRSDYRRLTQRLAVRWLDTVAELREHGVVHSDFQHGNILVDETFACRLVDYDDIVLPSMDQELSATALGHEGYQHPSRPSAAAKDARTFEDFSSLVVLSAILAATPKRWASYHADGEGLLLRASDLADPDRSDALREFQRGDDDAATVAKWLRDALSSVDESTAALTRAAALVGRPLPPWSSGTASHQAGLLPAPEVRTAAGHAKGHDRITAIEVLTLLGLEADLSETAIAREAGVPQSEIRRVVRRLEQRLEVPKASLANEARRAGLLDRPSDEVIEAPMAEQPPTPIASERTEGQVAVPVTAPVLSGRQLSILGGVAAGKSIEEIAIFEELAVATTRRHLRRLHRLLDAKDHDELLQRASEWDLIPKRIPRRRLPPRALVDLDGNTEPVPSSLPPRTASKPVPDPAKLTMPRVPKTPVVAKPVQTAARTSTPKPNTTPVNPKAPAQPDKAPEPVTPPESPVPEIVTAVLIGVCVVVAWMLLLYLLSQ